MIKNGMVNALNNFIMVNYILKVNIWMEKLDWERIWYKRKHITYMKLKMIIVINSKNIEINARNNFF